MDAQWQPDASALSQIIQLLKESQRNDTQTQRTVQEVRVPEWGKRGRGPSFSFPLFSALTIPEPVSRLQQLPGAGHVSAQRGRRANPFYGRPYSQEQRQGVLPQVRTTSGVIVCVRRMFVGCRFPDQVKEYIKKESLHCIGNESPLIRATVGLVISMIANKGELVNWPELLPSLCQLMESPEQTVCEVSRLTPCRGMDGDAIFEWVQGYLFFGLCNTPIAFRLSSK